MAPRGDRPGEFFLDVRLACLPRIIRGTEPPPALPHDIRDLTSRDARGARPPLAGLQRLFLTRLSHSEGAVERSRVCLCADRFTAGCSSHMHSEACSDVFIRKHERCREVATASRGSCRGPGDRPRFPGRRRDHLVHPERHGRDVAAAPRQQCHPDRHDLLRGRRRLDDQRQQQPGGSRPQQEQHDH